ncbi:MAG TPA: LysM domain-containing protein [Chthoniobacterales bacterium]|nr:LysM domain-containing protein [Chthoniobacterales bacterium]
MRIRYLLLFSAVAFCSAASAQTEDKPANGQFDAILKKLDEQNMKIDALSQQLLKLEQQVASKSGGVIIGEPTPTAAPATSTGSGSASAAATPASGNAHVVAKGETLISIAKAHKVDVDALQKHNNIEDARKLQAGQTIMIPTPGQSPGATASPSPN